MKTSHAITAKLIKKGELFFILVLLLFISVSVASPNEEKPYSRIKRRWAFGVNYPGLLVKYGVSNSLAIDLHAQFSLEPNIVIAGPRLYFYLDPTSPAIVYLGAELNGGIISGEVFERLNDLSIIAGVAGLEIFLGESISFFVEISPGLLMIGGTEHISESTKFHTVANVGLNYYTRSLKQKEQERKRREGEAIEILAGEERKLLEIKIPKKKFNVAILDLGAQNVSQMDAQVVKNFMQIELVNTGAVTVLERASMDKILAEQKFQMTGCTTRECAVEIGKILNVEKVVIGNFSKALGIYYISAQIVDIESGESEVAESTRVSSPDDLQSAAEELARELIRKLLEKHPQQ